MTYKALKDLPKRTSSDKVLHNRAFSIAKNQKYVEYQHRFASMVYKKLIKSMLVLLPTQVWELILKTSN